MWMSRTFCVKMAVVSMVTQHGRGFVPSVTERFTKRLSRPRLSMMNNNTGEKTAKVYMHAGEKMALVYTLSQDILASHFTL